MLGHITDIQYLYGVISTNNIKNENRKRKEGRGGGRPSSVPHPRLFEGGACHALQPDLLHQQCHLYPGGMDTPQQGAEG